MHAATLNVGDGVPDLRIDLQDCLQSFVWPCSPTESPTGPAPMPADERATHELQ